MPVPVHEPPDGVTHRLLFVRHGEPVAHAKGRLYGKLDVGLSAKGQAQVHALAAGPRSRCCVCSTGDPGSDRGGFWTMDGSQRCPRLWVQGAEITDPDSSTILAYSNVCVVPPPP